MDEKDNNKDAFDMDKPKFRFILNGIPFESDMPEVIIGPAITSENELQELRVRVSDEVKTYDRMCYTTDVGTAGMIFKNMTIRGSSLTNAKLNDSKEKERIGVSQYAGGRFITCFSHIDHEIVPFWTNYGGNDKSKKVLLKFDNFARHINECIYMDYCLVADDKKLFFYSDEYKQTLKNNCEFSQVIGLPQINADFIVSNCVRGIEVLDVDYVPSDNYVFITDFAGATDIDVSKFSSNPGQTILKDIKTFKPDCLGREKSTPWDYERESRILCCLNNQQSSEFMYIDLRLKQEMFRDLVIVLSPWANDELQSQLEDIIEKSILVDEIKNSIIIIHSELEGTLNF